MEELGSVAGLRVLDLGCGDAALGRVLLSAGCARYLGVDGSERMVRAARESLRGTPAEIVRGDIEDFAAAPAAFDLGWRCITSRTSQPSCPPPTPASQRPAGSS